MKSKRQTDTEFKQKQNTKDVLDQGRNRVAENQI